MWATWINFRNLDVYVYKYSSEKIINAIIFLSTYAHFTNMEVCFM